ncbi:MAG TPA: MDR family MFS transporter [Caldilineaceae bacterium]|nr:MDR family MFS transporter [Caldilineaceae bacterium]
MIRAKQRQASLVQPIAVPPEAGMHGSAALLAMFGIMSVVLLAALDQTIVGTALPRVVAELGGFDLYGWVATSYLLTSTVMVPIMGKLGDLYGRKPFLLAAVVVFVGASALAGAAQSMLWLVAARGIQGVGAGMLQATAFTSVSDMFPQPARRARWQGLITSTFGIASVVGPVLGGVMTEGLGWRSVFYINLPIGLLALSLIHFTLPGDLSPRTPQARIDWAGVATITAAISALLLAVEWGGNTFAWRSPAILSLFTVAGVALLAFALIELRAAEPLLPLDLFRNQAILFVNLISLLLGFALFALVYYTPLLLQGGLGLSPSAAGALQTPLAVSTAVGSLISGQIFARTQWMKGLLTCGAVLMLLGAFLLLWVNTGSNPLRLSGTLALAGLGAGFQFPMLTLLVQSIVPRTRLGVSTSTVQFLRLIGSTIGTAIVASAVNAVFAAQLQAAVSPNTNPRLVEAFQNPQALIDPRAQGRLEQLVHQLGPEAAAQAQQLAEAAHGALIGGIRVGYIMALVMALASLALVLFLRTPDFRGQVVSAPASDDSAPDLV